VIAYEVALWCDAQECQGSIVWDIVHNVTNAQIDARAHARQHDWTRRRIHGRMVDLCPEHS